MLLTTHKKPSKVDIYEQLEYKRQHIVVSRLGEMQRQKEHRPMMANKASRFLPADCYVVETQRTSGGKDQRTGENTRPYRFGEFDILAVSMHPSTKNWNSFRYTVADWLLPMPTNKKLLLKFQPVSSEPDEDWTDDLLTCIKWLRSGKRKTLGQKKA